MPSRPQTVTVAAILLVLFSVFNLSLPLFPTEGIPPIAPYLAVVEGAAGLLGAIGLWRLRKWGIWLTIVVCVLNILDAAGGAVGAPNPALRVAATITVVGFVLILVLVVLPASRRAFAAS